MCIYSAQFLVEKKSLDVLAPFQKDPSFTYILFTNCADVKLKAEEAGWTCILVQASFELGTLCSKHVKWLPWEYFNTHLYDILVWVDGFSNVNPLYFDYLKTMIPQFSTRKHRSSQTVSDEINLCFLNKKINENIKKKCEEFLKTNKYHPFQYWTEIVIHPSDCKTHKAFCKEMFSVLQSLVYRDQVCMPFVQKSLNYTHVAYMPKNFSIRSGERKNHEYVYDSDEIPKSFTVSSPRSPPAQEIKTCKVKFSKEEEMFVYSF